MSPFRLAARAAAASVLGATALLALATRAAGAQGSVSTQGFGYPPGHLSTRAMATGGAFGPFDPQSAVNPASIWSWGPAALHFNYSPEFRRVKLNGGTSSSGISGGSDRTTTIRFPLIAAAVNVGERLVLGLSGSTLLDRSWATRNDLEEIVLDDTVRSVQTLRSAGAINDLRLAAAYDVVPRKFHVGVGLHTITGENRLSVLREFEDTARFAALSQASTLSYSGLALSVGAEWQPVEQAAIAVSVRRGGTIRANLGDSLVSSGEVPNQYTAALRFTGLEGVAVAAHVDRIAWSSLGGLGSSQLRANDATNFGAGLEGLGPRFAGRVVLLRAGVDRRELPFAVRGSGAKEMLYSFGFGAPIAQGRAGFDFGLARALRTASIAATPQSAGGKVDESAWIMSLGLTVRY